MIKLQHNGITIRLYTITDMCQDFKKSRPYITNALDDIRKEYGEKLFNNHSCYSKLDNTLKRPALYVSEDIYQLIQHRVYFDNLKKKLINLLPDNIYDLKQIILQQQLFFIRQLKLKPTPLLYRDDLDALKEQLDIK